MIPKTLRPFAHMIDSVVKDSDGVWVNLRDGLPNPHQVTQHTRTSRDEERAKMGRELINQELTADNIDEARFSGDVDPVDTLRRIASAWLALRRDWLPIQVKCRCGSNEACDICEIDYLLCEAFRLPSTK